MTDTRSCIQAIATLGTAPLLAEAPDLFFVAGSPRSRKVFYRDPSGRATGYGDRREGHDVPWRKVAA